MLASIQMVSKISPIPLADRIETARVLGWDCVVRKGTFKEGDLCIYIEIDTLIPTCFLSEKQEDREKYTRLKTVKMKGQLSQGLALPLFCPGVLMLFDLKAHTNYFSSVKEGDDVTEYLKVKKYEKAIPESMRGLMKGDFPVFVPKTDEVRIQSGPHALSVLNGHPYYITVKMDGTSGTFFRYKDVFGVCSRNILLEPDSDNIYNSISKKYNLDKVIPEGFAIQGEICGPGIQQNRLGLAEPTLYVFNIWDIVNSKYLDYEEFRELCQDLGLTKVPTIEEGLDFHYTQEELLELAKGKYPNTSNDREGIVVRAQKETYCRGLSNNRMSFKVLNNDYLLNEY